LEKYELAILLGSQVKKKNGIYFLAPHTELKADAAILAFKHKITGNFIVSGGHNFNVRYDDQNILSKADFSFEAFIKGKQEQSEAQIIKQHMINHGVPGERIFTEELSATTQENAEIVKILLKRTTFNFAKKIGLITLIYQMERALPEFKNAGVDAEPLFAEDLLALEGKTSIDRICQYYSVPKAGKQWDINRISDLLSSARSIGELL
jgi:uncharacterized SAM-binding protein YcdF (DUF218 family)